MLISEPYSYLLRLFIPIPTKFQIAFISHLAEELQ